jgi:hypothetical protein
MNKKLIHLLFGKPISLLGMTLILSTGLIVGLLTYFFLQEFSASNIIVSILAADIGAGLISNSRPQTHKEWKLQPRWVQWTFVIFHLTIYPIVLFLLTDNILVLSFLITLLTIKTALFFIGVILRK